MKLILFTDGGSRGNPGPAAYGFVLFSTLNDAPIPSSRSSLELSQNPAAIILEKCGKYLGITTNNQAEYAGLINGIKRVVENHPQAELDIYMDSLLIVNQVKGLYKVKNADLLPKYQEVRALLTKLPQFSINYVPRAQNSVADLLVNQALDSQK